MYSDIPEQLKALVEPVLGEQDLELVDLEVIRGRVPWSLRLTIDTACGDGRVPIERCAEVSREIGARLEAADAIPVSYVLEVSSPGLDRKLSREKDFARACGSEVRIETRGARDGRRRFRGLLLGFEAGVARVSVDGTSMEIPFAEVARANTVYSFSREDFGRGGGPGSRGAGRGTGE